MKTTIGIDPSTQKHKLAIACVNWEKKEIHTQMLPNIYRLIEWIKGQDKSKISVAIEDAYLQKQTQFKTSCNTKINGTLGRKGGMVIGYSLAISQMIEGNGFDLTRISPLKKGSKWSKDALNSHLRSEGFSFGSNALSNEDKRDAITVAMVAKYGTDQVRQWRSTANAKVTQTQLQNRVWSKRSRNK